MRAVSESTRTRRFSLPDLGDDGVDEAIRSFLSGPQQGRGRPDATVVSTANTGGAAFAALETRIAWLGALRREMARSARYNRPASVLVIAGEANASSPDASAWLTRVAGPIAHAVQRGVRETDLVTRTGEACFQVLMPETTEPEASVVAERVVLDCQVWLQAVGAPVIVRAAAATADPDTTLEVALGRALQAAEPTRPG